jgi:hypothetical protein
MRAEVTLRRSALVGIDVDRIVGAGLHAGLASDAALGTEIHDAIFALIHRGDGTDSDARRIFAVIATRDLEDPPGIGEHALFHILHPGAVHAERNMVFGFTGHGACMAADALSVVDDKAVSHSGNLCWQNLLKRKSLQVPADQRS